MGCQDKTGIITELLEKFRLSGNQASKKPAPGKDGIAGKTSILGDLEKHFGG